MSGRPVLPSESTTIRCRLYQRQRIIIGGVTVTRGQCARLSQLHSSQQAHDHSGNEEPRGLAIDDNRSEIRIRRLETHSGAIGVESLHCGFFADDGDNNVASLSGFLFPDKNKVTVFDAVISHTLACDSK